MKTSRFFILALAAAVICASCGKDNDPDPAPKSGVLINGVRWAEYNVDAPGTFAATPESPGMFYKWGSKVGWSATGEPTSSPADKAWADVAPESGNDWLADNDPCPAGWRVPTLDDFTALCDVGGTKVTKAWDASKKGYTFTDIASNQSIFLPAAGYRSSSNGTLNFAGVNGYCWSGMLVSAGSAWGLDFNSTGASQSTNVSAVGFTVRCVRQ